MERDARKRVQREILHELETRIARGSAGSVQNQFRRRFYFFRAQGLPFELSVLVAAARIREQEPDFVPKILSLRVSTEDVSPPAFAGDDSTLDLDCA